jgi:hypothetical protein
LTENANADPWPWPDSRDAVIAAPQHHKVLSGNERVRVLEVRIAPGESGAAARAPLASSIYVARQSDFLGRDHHGNLLFDSRTLGPPPSRWRKWTPHLPPHSAENIGSNEILLMSTELNGPASV